MKTKKHLLKPIVKELADMFRMKYTDIVVGELNFVRYKTRNIRNDETYISIPILGPMKRIIQKHGNKSKDGLIFPICNNCKGETDKRKKICAITYESNKRIKAICKELKKLYKPTVRT